MQQSAKHTLLEVLEEATLLPHAENIISTLQFQGWRDERNTLHLEVPGRQCEARAAPTHPYSVADILVDSAALCSGCCGEQSFPRESRLARNSLSALGVVLLLRAVEQSIEEQQRLCNAAIKHGSGSKKVTKDGVRGGKPPALAVGRQSPARGRRPRLRVLLVLHVLLWFRLTHRGPPVGRRRQWRRSSCWSRGLGAWTGGPGTRPAGHGRSAP